MSISHIGSGKEISDIDTESSEEAKACRRYYETALKSTLRDFNWSFARRVVALGLVEDMSSQSTEEFTYSYRYPSDAVKIRRIKSGMRNDTRQSRSVFWVTSDDTGRLIYSNEENAEAEYTKHITDTLLYPDDFTLAFSYKLAALIAPRLSSGDLFGMKDKMQRYYEIEISTAESNGLNEDQDDELPDSEFVRVRS
jgi:hypothetical protein